MAIIVIIHIERSVMTAQKNCIYTKQWLNTMRSTRRNVFEKEKEKWKYLAIPRVHLHFPIVLFSVGYRNPSSGM